jgi:hypothetical protein
MPQTDFIPPAENIPLGYMPRYQIGREFSILGWQFRYWREVHRHEFFDKMIDCGLLAPSSDIEATTILHAAGMVSRAGRRLFRVLKY